MIKIISIIFLFNLQILAGIGLINISSTSHSLGVSSNLDEVIINWRTPTSTDKLLKYRWKFDKNSTSILDEDTQAKDIPASSNSLNIPLEENSDGEWFFHIIAITEFGDSGVDTHFGKIIVDRTPPKISIANQILDNLEIEVSLKSPEIGTSIFYTLDNSTPTENSLKYENPFRIYSDKTIKFIGIDSSKNISSVSEKRFSVSYSGNIVKFDNIVEGQIIATTSKNGALNSIPKIKVSAVDLVSYKYRFDSDLYSESSGGEIDIANLSDGKHSLFIKGVDSIGNTQISPSKISFVIDNTSPQFITGKIDNQILGQRNIFGANKYLIISTDENATVRYSTDGDTPTKTFGKIYQDSILVTKNLDLQLIAYDNLGNVGKVENISIIIDRENPTLPKIFDSQNVELNSSYSAFYENRFLFQKKDNIFHFTSSDNYTTSPKIIWTLDNSIPNLLNSNFGDVEISESATLRFLAVDEVNNSTEIQSLDFVIDNNPPKNLEYQILSDGCIFENKIYNCLGSQVKIKLSAVDNETPKDIKLFYTLNGKNPTDSDLRTDSNNSLILNLTQNETTFKFVAYDRVGNRSDEKSFVIHNQPINNIIEAQSLSLNNSSLINSEKVGEIRVTISKSGDNIYYYYRFDNNSSYSFENDISKGIDISKLNDGIHTLSVIASNNNEVNSSINKISFTVDNTAPEKPVITGNRDFNNSTTVSISLSDSLSQIYYTLNGATPSLKSYKYSEALIFTETTTLKAVGIDDVNNISEIADMTFNKYVVEVVETGGDTNSDSSSSENTNSNNGNHTETNNSNNSENTSSEETEQKTSNSFNIVDIEETDFGEKLTIENSNGDVKNISINFPKDSIFSDDGNRTYSLDNTKVQISNAGTVLAKVGNILDISSELDFVKVTMIQDKIIIQGEQVVSDNGDISEIKITSNTEFIDINLTVNNREIYFPKIYLNGEKATVKTYLKNNKSINFELEIPLNSHSLVF